MTGVSERLDAIEARAANCRTYNFGMRAADKLAHEDVWDLLDLARKQQAALDAVKGIERRLEKSMQVEDREIAEDLRDSLEGK